MTWSDLQPGVRAAILVATFVVVLLLVWSFVLAPLWARQASLASQLAAAEGQLTQMERQIEAVPPATQQELADWQTSGDALFSQLGPESELPLFIEALVRLSESQGVDAFVSAADASDVSAGSGGLASQTEQVLGAIRGARRVPLMVSAFGDYAGMSRFVAQIGRLGWVTELGGVEMVRAFPEMAAEIIVVVYFRAASGDVASASSAPGGTNQPPMGAQGGR
jgi:Tfp pilus assembly protein PilO